MAGSSGSPVSGRKVNVSDPTKSAGKGPPKLTVTVSSLPGLVVVGKTTRRDTGGRKTVNGSPFDGAPRGPTTLTVTPPGVVNRLAGTSAFNPPVTGVVVSAVLFQRMTEPASNPIPFAVRLKVGLPTWMVF